VLAEPLDHLDRGVSGRLEADLAGTAQAASFCDPLVATGRGLVKIQPWPVIGADDSHDEGPPLDSPDVGIVVAHSVIMPLIGTYRSPR
jgi:hypothetical protein